MKIFLIIWRDPNGNLTEEKFDAEKFKIHTEPGWLKLHSKEHGQIVRLLPSERVSIVQFGEEPEESKIVVPRIVPDLPNKFEAG